MLNKQNFKLKITMTINYCCVLRTDSFLHEVKIYTPCIRSGLLAVVHVVGEYLDELCLLGDFMTELCDLLIGGAQLGLKIGDV